MSVCGRLRIAPARCRGSASPPSKGGFVVNETNASATMTSNERTARAMADNATAVYPDRHLYNGRRKLS